MTAGIRARNETPTDSELDHLRSKHRSVLFLWRSGVRDYIGLSSQLGVPIGTVRSRLNRARNALLKLRERTNESPMAKYVDRGIPNTQD